MITIGSKNKILLFDISTEGISRENLEFWFRIYNEDVVYSFRGELTEDNKVKVIVYPLTEMVNNNYLDLSKVYPANLEVIGDKKYHMTTWEGELKLEAAPRIGVKLENMVDDYNKPVIKENQEVKKVVVTSISETKEVEEPKNIKESSEKNNEDVIQNSLNNEPQPVVQEETEKKNVLRHNSLLEDVLRTNSKKKTKKSVDILAELK